MKWIYLPQYPERWLEVLIAIKYADMPIQAFWDGTQWRGSCEVRDWMNDGYCDDSTILSEHVIYAWCELPKMPDLPKTEDI